jgi:hypothetical protein
LLLRYFPLLRELGYLPGLELEELEGASIAEGAICRFLVEHRGVEIIVCDESSHMTTGTYKDLDACLTTAVLRAAGAEAVALSSAGNLGRALASYCGRVGLEVFFFHPATTLYKLDASPFARPGVHLVSVDLPEKQVKSLARGFAAAYALPHLPDVELRTAASAARAAFLVEQSADSGHVADHIAQTVCAGYGPIGIYDCFERLVARGFIARDSIPRFLGFQQDANAPLVRAWQDRSDVIQAQHIAPAPDDYLEPGLYNTNPHDTYPKLRSILETHGGDLATITRAQFTRYADTVLGWLSSCGYQFARQPGLSGAAGVLERAGLLTGVGIAAAIEEGRVRPGERIVYLLTGGLRRISAEAESMPVPSGVRVDASRSEAEWIRFLGRGFGLLDRSIRRTAFC